MARGCSPDCTGCSPDRTGLQPGFHRAAGASARAPETATSTPKIVLTMGLLAMGILTNLGHLDANDALARREAHARHPQELVPPGGGDGRDCVPQRQDAAREERLGLLPRPPPAARPGAVWRPARVDALRMVAGHVCMCMCMCMCMCVHACVTRVHTWTWTWTWAWTWARLAHAMRVPARSRDRGCAKLPRPRRAPAATRGRTSRSRAPRGGKQRVSMVHGAGAR